MNPVSLELPDLNGVSLLCFRAVRISVNRTGPWIPVPNVELPGKAGPHGEYSIGRNHLLCQSHLERRRLLGRRRGSDPPSAGSTRPRRPDRVRSPPDGCQPCP
jgi:hypothetical protein